MIRKLWVNFNYWLIEKLLWLSELADGKPHRACSRRALDREGRADPASLDKLQSVAIENMNSVILENFKSEAFVQLLRHSAKCKSQECKNAIFNDMFSLVRSDSRPCDIAQPLYERWQALEQTRTLDEAIKLVYPEPRS